MTVCNHKYTSMSLYSTSKIPNISKPTANSACNGGRLGLEV